MIGRSPAVPEGYARETIGRAMVVVRVEQLGAMREVLGQKPTLYEWAAAHPEHRRFEGRGAVYAAPLPGETTMVAVRHARHGGLLARWTGDRFAGRTRAPRELDASLRLAAAGVRTPLVVGYLLYPAGPGLRRSDVATRLVEGEDLASALRAADPVSRRRPLVAAARLLAALARAGAQHPDLNLKNVLVPSETSAETEAFVLDVDRVRFGPPHSSRIAAANLARLERSLAKWGLGSGPPLGAAELALLRAAD